MSPEHACPLPCPADLNNYPEKTKNKVCKQRSGSKCGEQLSGGPQSFAPGSLQEPTGVPKSSVFGGTVGKGLEDR